jgi:hypothetical protein
MLINLETSQGMIFEARNLTDSEKQIAEKDFLSIIKKCHEKLELKEDSGEICDAFIAYYLTQCDTLDNLLSYCDVYLPDDLGYGNPIREYDYMRGYQEGCINQNRTITEKIFCEDYIDIPGESERRFLETLTNKSHLIIPSATLYTNEYNSQVFGEVMNNYTYPIEFTQIHARFNYTNGSAIDFDHDYTQDSIIKPGEKSGFWFFFENPLPKTTRFAATTEFQRSNTSLPEKLLVTVTYPDNTMSIHSSVGANGKISGNITNLGNITATSVRINAIFYDVNGKVSDVNTEYVNIGTGLLPGKSQSFSMQPILHYEKRDKIVSYLLNAESNEYSIIRQNSTN